MNRLKRILAFSTVVAVLSLVALTAGSDTTSAGTFNPTLTVTVLDPTPEKASDVKIEFGIGPGELLTSGVVAFIDPNYGVVKGDAIPIGTKVGDLNATATLGLINAACNTSLQIDFEFLNASLDRSDTVTWKDTQKDDPTMDGYGVRDALEDPDDNGLVSAIEQYPEFIDRVVGDNQPIRRVAGVTKVAGIGVLLQFLVFAPGTELDLPGEDLERLLPKGPELGYPTVVLLQDAGDPEPDPEPGAITDVCAPLVSTTTTYGLGKDFAETDVTEGGEIIAVNPTDGTYKLTIFTVGQRDADNDGIMNLMDTCPYEANAGDPTLPGDGDLDQDGMDATCDENDDPLAAGTNSDQDGDGYLNRQDNCPLEANGQDLEDEATRNQQDDDFDLIGDVCDRDPVNPDGELTQALLEAPVVIGNGNGGEPGDAPSDEACGGPDRCFRPDTDVVETSGPTEPADTEPSKSPDDKNDDGGSNTILIVGIIAAAAAAVVVVGGGLAVLRRNSGG